MLHSQAAQNGVLGRPTVQLCKHYYFKAAEIFTELNETNDIIGVLLQHTEFEEFLALSRLTNIVFRLCDNSLITIFSFLFLSFCILDANLYYRYFLVALLFLFSLFVCVCEYVYFRIYFCCN